MMRGISIFAFFTVSTILVIILQPGPRETFVNQPNPQALLEATRNETHVFQTPQIADKLPVPDDVIAELKKGVQPRPQNQADIAVIETETALQPAQTSSTPEAVFVETVAAPPQPQPEFRQPQGAIQAVAPELRDMSWQTLNALNTIGHVSKAPGQQGSLLNSIVRRSMGYVDGTQVVRPATSSNTTFTAPRSNLTIAEAARVLVLEDIPRLSRNNFNEAKRFVTLIDALYEARVQLIASAAATPEMLYVEGAGTFEFERTASRLREMQSADWGRD